MTWWAWTLLWLVLVIGAAGYLFLLLRALWRKLSALFTELGAAAELMGTVSEQLEALNEAAAAASARSGTAEPEPAVFADPQVLRRQRDRDIKRRVRQARASARRGEPARRSGSA